MKNRILFFTVLMLALAVFLAPTAVQAQRAAIGFFDGRGSIGVEDDDGDYREIEARPSVRYKQWLDEASAFEITAQMQTAGDQNLQFSAFYLQHFPQGNIYPYFGGGLTWSDDAVGPDGDEDDLIALGLPVGIEWDFGDNPFSLNIHATNALILDPETDLSIGQRVDFGLYYYF